MENGTAYGRNPDTEAAAMPFRISRPAVIILSLCMVLGLLCIPFGGAGFFSGIAVIVLCSAICVLSRGCIPVLALMLPFYAVILFTGNFTVPSLVIGISVSASCGAFMCRGGGAGKAAVVISAVISGLTVFAVTGNPAVCFSLLVPVVCAVMLRLIYGKAEYGTSIAILCTGIIISAGAAFAAAYMIAPPEWMTVLIPRGAATAEIPGLWRSLITESLVSIETSAGPFTDLQTAQIAASLIINLLPGLVIMAAEFLAFLQYKLIGAFFTSAGVGGCIPQKCTVLELTPVTGLLCFACFVTVGVCSDSYGGNAEFIDIAAENMIMMIAPLLIVVGTRTVYRFICGKLISKQNGRTIAFIAVLIIFSVSAGLFASVMLSVGIAHTLMPAFRQIKNKLRNDKGEN